MSDSDEKKDYTEPVEPQTLESGEQSLPVGFRGLTQTPTKSDYFTIFASGCALFSDGFQNNLMTGGNAVFTRVYAKAYTSVVSTRVSNALIVGAILGQLGVGVICDRLGRKAGIIVSTLMIVLGAVLATASNPESNPARMFWMMTVARGITGIGVGGEYPASSTSASESCNERFGKNRGRAFILVTNLVLSLGGPVVLSLFLIIISGLKYHGTTSADDLRKLNISWRILFALGIVFPLAVFYFRIRMLNSKLYRRNAIQRRVPYWLAVKKYWATIIGTAGTWWLYDFVTFPNGIFSSQIIAEVIPGATLKTTLLWQLALSVMSLPGVFIGCWLINYIGRRNLLMLGFSGYLVIGLIIGVAYDQITVTKYVPAFIILYGIMQSMGNGGPGNCEGLISAESYPSAIRGTMYGFSAAFGKFGAVCGTEAFTPIQTHLGKRYTFIISACCGVVGIIIAFFFVKDKTSDDLAREDEEFRKYLLANGWDGEMGDGSEGLHKADELEDHSKLTFD